MKLALLAAGESSRIKKEGLKSPKPLLRVGGEPMFSRLIGIARRNGFSSVHCIINENEPMLKDYITENDFGIRIQLTVKSTPSSMHSLFELAPQLKEENFFLATADTIFGESEFGSFMDFCMNSTEYSGILSITHYIDDEKPLCVEMDNNFKILSFKDAINGSDWVTAGIYYFSPLIFNELQPALNMNISRLRNFFRFLLKNNYTLRGFPIGKVIDVDYPKDLIIAEEFLKSRNSDLKFENKRKSK